MLRNIARNCATSSLHSAGCGQKTTTLVTDAERQNGPRRRLLPASLPGWGAWVFVCWGCGTFVTATPINPAPRPLVARTPESVQVLASGAPLEPHVDVALLEAEQDEGWNRQGTDYMIQRLREKAAELGCDALYVKSKSFHEERDSTHLLASCVVFTPPGSAALETAGTPRLPSAPAPR